MSQAKTRRVYGQKKKATKTRRDFERKHKGRRTLYHHVMEVLRRRGGSLKTKEIWARVLMRRHCSYVSIVKVVVTLEREGHLKLAAGYHQGRYEIA